MFPVCMASLVVMVISIGFTFNDSHKEVKQGIDGKDGNLFHPSIFLIASFVFVVTGIISIIQQLI